MVVEVASDNGEVTSSARALDAAKREGAGDWALFAKLPAIGWSFGTLKSWRTESGILGMLETDVRKFDVKFFRLLLLSPSDLLTNLRVDFLHRIPLRSSSMIVIILLYKSTLTLFFISSNPCSRRRDDYYKRG